MILRNISFRHLHVKSGSDKKKDASFSFSVIVVDLRCEKICAQSRFQSSDHLKSIKMEISMTSFSGDHPVLLRR